MQRLSHFISDSKSARVSRRVKTSWDKVSRSLLRSFDTVESFISNLAAMAPSAELSALASASREEMGLERRGDKAGNSGSLERIDTVGKGGPSRRSDRSILIPIVVELNLTTTQLARHGWTQSMFADGLQKDLEAVLRVSHGALFCSTPSQKESARRRRRNSSEALSEPSDVTQEDLPLTVTVCLDGATVDPYHIKDCAVKEDILADLPKYRFARFVEQQELRDSLLSAADRLLVAVSASDERKSDAEGNRNADGKHFAGIYEADASVIPIEPEVEEAEVVKREGLPEMYADAMELPDNDETLSVRDFDTDEVDEELIQGRARRARSAESDTSSSARATQNRLPQGMSSGEDVEEAIDDGENSFHQSRSSASAIAVGHCFSSFLIFYFVSLFVLFTLAFSSPHRRSVLTLELNFFRSNTWGLSCTSPYQCYRSRQLRLKTFMKSLVRPGRASRFPFRKILSNVINSKLRSTKTTRTTQISFCAAVYGSSPSSIRSK